MASGYYDKNGIELDLDEWAKLMQDRDYSIIKQTRHKEKGREFWLSTVWLGLDHNFSGGEPITFETMALEFIPTKSNQVVATEDDWFWQERYASEEAAIESRDPWRVATTDKPDMLKVLLEVLRGKAYG